MSTDSEVPPLSIDGRASFPAVSLVDSAETCRGSPPSARADVVTALLKHGHVRTGLTLGHYKLGKCLAEGTTGVVYKARDLRCQRWVAVKLFRGTGLGANTYSRLIREARCAAAITHPNIVAVHDFGYDRGMPYIVMEYVPGRDLAEILRCGKLPVERALHLAVQIAAALAEVHSHGMVYRDLKPANVRVTRNDLVKLVDFGLAKYRRKSKSHGSLHEITHMGAILGTVAYMSPEQARGRRLSARSDVFTFGATLYEMLADRAAFRRSTMADTMTAVLRDDMPELPQRVPAALGKIVRRCLQKDWRRRFKSMKPVLAELHAVQESMRR